MSVQENPHLQEITEVLSRIAAGDFSARVAPYNENPYLEALGIGINMLAEEIEIKIKEVNEKIAELEQLNRLMVDRELKMIELKNEIEELKKKIAILSKNSSL